MKGKKEYMSKKIHISIDDTINIFEDLNSNYNYYKSIFDNKTLNLLRNLHNNYNMVFHLYCFYENLNASFKLEMCTDKFKKEFRKNKKWLKINFHGKNGNTNLANVDIFEFKNLFYNFERQIKRICGSRLTNSTRLHNYDATYEQISFLKKEKINKLFVSEKKVINCYNLQSIEMEIIEKNGRYFNYKDKIEYIKAHVRLDYCQNILKEIEKLNNNTIYIFMHEWMFFDNFSKMQKDIEMIGKWSKENKCKFI